MRVVLNDQQDCIVGLQIVAIIWNLLHYMIDGSRDRELCRRERKRRSPLCAGSDRRGAGRGRTNVGLREVERECAAMPRSAAQLDFSTKQTRQFTADCQTKPGASVLATGTGIGLLEGLEDDALFFEGDADTGIRNLE